MNSTLLRVVLGALLALALLDGVLARPHASHEQQPQQQHRPNDLSVRHGHHPHRRHHHHVQQLCGAELSNALRHLCAGRGYNSPDNMAGSSASRHGHRGLASECCHVGCTLSDLEHYCQPRKTPLVASQSTSESHETAEYESDPRPETGNHIRPAAVEAEAEAPQENDQKQKAPLQPTVVGGNGKVGGKLNMASYDATNMIQVGVLISPLQNRTPVTIPSRPQSNSLGSH